VILVRVLFFLLITISCYGQQNGIITPEIGRYAIDTIHRIAVWSPSAEARDYLWSNFSDSIYVNDRLYAMSSNSKLLFNSKDSLKLVKTKIPLIQIHTRNPIVDEPKTLVQIQFTHNDILIDLPAGIELRGNSAMRYPKKSYDIEFRNPENPEESMDIKLEDMREDDDWILNSIYNEPLRLRSHLSNALWKEIRATANNTGNASGVNLRYAEVFLNNEYKGAYLISEQVDRKLLKLKKKNGDTVRGELFKAGSYQPGCQFTDAPPFNNAFPSWAGFDMKYPFDDYTAHWDDLAQFIALVSKGSDEDFNTSISQWLIIDNAIDYYLFVNLLRATDNLGKNYFLARIDDGEPYFFIPWDLDGVMGTIMDGKRIPTTDDILSNGLFDRLWENNPSNYQDKVRSRWKDLRSGVLSNDVIFSKIEQLYTALTDLGVYEREMMLWDENMDPRDDYEYLDSWLRARLTFLDEYFSTN